MKKLFIFALLPAIFLLACQDDKLHNHHEHEPASVAETEECHKDMPKMNASSTGYTTEMSVYNLDSRWTSQEGESMELHQLKGKVQMVAMVYTSCSYACPRIVADLRRIEEQLAGYRKEDVGIVLVTLDPDRDTPEKLKAYAEKNKLNAKRWLFLTSEETHILELAALLNVKYKKEANNEISHSNIISVLNKEGEVVHQQEGLGVDPDETVKAIVRQLRTI